MKMKIAVELSMEDYEILMFILQKYITKHKFERQIDHSFTVAEKEWMVRHADYVQSEILDKIISGTERIEEEN